MTTGGIFPESLQCPLHFQGEDYTTPQERLDAAEQYARFHQTKLIAPCEGIARPARRKTGSG